MKFLEYIIVPASTVFLYAALTGACAKPGKNLNDTDLTKVPIEKLAAEFREIRTIKSHFDDGTRTDDVDQWNGRKHRLITATERNPRKTSRRRNTM